MVNGHLFNILAGCRKNNSRVAIELVYDTDFSCPCEFRWHSVIEAYWPPAGNTAESLRKLSTLTLWWLQRGGIWRRQFFLILSLALECNHNQKIKADSFHRYTHLLIPFFINLKNVCDSPARIRMSYDSSSDILLLVPPMSFIRPLTFAGETDM